MFLDFSHVLEQLFFSELPLHFCLQLKISESGGLESLSHYEFMCLYADTRCDEMK